MVQRWVHHLVVVAFIMVSSQTFAFDDSSFSSSYGSSWEDIENCKCSSRLCPEVPESCAHGLVTAPGDTCGCCYVCGNEEWSYCDPDPVEYPEYFTYYMPWEKPPPKPMWNPVEHSFGRCGWGLRCVLTDGLGPKNSLPVFVCQCHDEDIVCGSDGKTYENPCELREDAAKSGESVALRERAMCLGVPVIKTPPNNYTAEPAKTGTVIILSCEVNANPSATITWSKNGRVMQYRGPNRRKSIQSRPGISEYTMTGWLKIYGARDSDSAMYNCIATNSYGMVRASAEVKVKPHS